MGLFSSIGNFIGDLFGGGGGSNAVSSVINAATPTLNDPGLVSNLFTSSLNPSSWGNLLSSAGSALGGAATSALSNTDWLKSLGGNVVEPLVVPPPTAGAGSGSLVPQDWLNIAGVAAPSILGNLLQSPQPNFSPDQPQQPGQQQQPQQQPGQQQPAQRPATQTQAAAGGGNPITNILQGAGSNLPGLIAALPSLASFFQKDDPYGAESQLGAMAKDIHGRYNSVMDTATANQQGMINSQALRGIDRKLQQQEASIRQTYHQMGMSGSTMETQDLNNARMAAQDEVFQAGQEMASTGLSTAASLAGLESQDYQAMLVGEIERDKAFQEALSKIAAAAVTPASTTQINTGGGQSGTTSNPINWGSLGSLLPAGDPLESVINGITPQTNVPDLIPNIGVLPSFG